MKRFILDSNFFIQAHRANYPFDVVPSFWSKIQELAYKELLVSIDKVKDEIFRNDDVLTNWCKMHLPKDFFKDSSIAIAEYSELASWANSRNDHYRQLAIDEFLDTDAADAWLIAYAMNQDIPLLTHERSEPERRTRIKIPDVCHIYDVKYFTTVEMLRELGETI